MRVLRRGPLRTPWPAQNVTRGPHGIFESPWALPALGAVCLPHIPEAFSTLALARATRSLLAGKMPIQALACLVGLQVARLAAQPLGQWATQHWQDDATRMYADAFAQRLYNKPRLWLEHKPRETEVSMSFANDTPWAVQESVANTAAGVNTVAGMAINGLMIAVMLDSGVAVNFALALGAAAVAGKGVAGLQTAFKHQPRNALGESADAYFKTKRGDFWDNVVLGNKDCADVWAREYDLAFSDWSAHLVKREGIKNALALGASLACGAVAAGSLSRTAQAIIAAGDLPRFVGLALPMAWRACDSLNSASSMMNWLPNYQNHEQIFARVLRDTAPEATLVPQDHIGTGGKVITLTRGDEAVRVNRDNLAAVLDMTRKPGLITVQGPNGSGKSMLVTWVKDTLGESAFMWPAKNQLEFGLAPNSSGGIAMGALQSLGYKLQAYPGSRVVILDEVDANLDGANRELSKSLINQLAAQYCVVQITHRLHESGQGA